jgi:hypothetical protein
LFFSVPDQPESCLPAIKKGGVAGFIRRQFMRLPIDFPGSRPSWQHRFMAGLQMFAEQHGPENFYILFLIVIVMVKH